MTTLCNEESIQFRLRWDMKFIFEKEYAATAVGCQEK
jgi:hypothetical protein